MRIGIDATCWNNSRGYGRFTREVIPKLIKTGHEHDFVLLADKFGDEDIERLGAEVAYASVSESVVSGATASSSRTISDIFKFSRLAKIEKLDALYYPSSYSWFPPPLGIPSVVTIHDAIPEKHPELVFPEFKQRMFWSLKVWLAIKMSTRFVTVSSAAKAEISEHLKIPSRRIDVACEGASEIFSHCSDPVKKQSIREKYNIPADTDFLIYVGGFSPHKNLVNLIDAFEITINRSNSSNLHLVLVGAPDSGGFNTNFPMVEARAKQNESLAKKVTFTGFVPDTDLAALYSDSLAVILPSIAEGFGLPAIESMSCGTPVLAAEGGAVMEVAGDAGIYFDALDPARIADAIELISKDDTLRSSLCAAIIPELSRNTWQRSSECILQSILSCVSAE